MVTDDVFAVIAEATRRDILVSLQAGDKAVGELVEELAASQPTISKHLKVLREADLVSMRAQGQKRYYALNRKPLAGVASWLETFDIGRAASAAATRDAAPQEAADAQAGTARAASAGTSTGSLTPAAGSPSADVPDAFAAAAAAHAGTADDATHAPGRPASGQLSPAVVVPGGQVPSGQIPGTAGQDDTVPQQIGRTVGRAATKAADLLANLPKFGRKK
ncbi:metalloregulator ArsR/SmtB family transcription factor [Arthrobacter sp. FW305-BF8]|uniref:ArsR/SmtB family transcription factor n=1 Tax=Arthrobacter sp. FW305-BF8 TaxID=2879617 RepID=UPI001F0298FA|nr:metalloregulator ArsR/SmtB family transcription factor [Arthrobacter sp. FW305-BF8]UKA53675.1 metalloregulator ArsR/SmtB family transcription factor [Arthrobacter sp. FW305-BF8]